MIIPTVRPSFSLQITSVHFVLPQNGVTKPFCLKELDFIFFVPSYDRALSLYVDLVIILLLQM
jgi:hypothetical protein